MFGFLPTTNFEPRKTHFTHFKDLKRPEGIDGNCITVVVHQQRTWIWIIPFQMVLHLLVLLYPNFLKDFPENPTERMRRNYCRCSHTTKRFFNDAEMMFEPRTIEGYAISTKTVIWSMICTLW